MMYLEDLLKIAVVSDMEWVRQSVKLFAPQGPASVQVFYNADIEAASHRIIRD